MPDLNRILYVEDEPDIQEVAKIALETVGGFDIRICSNGNEAIEQAAEFNPDLFLLDVMMPGKDGPDTLKELRALEGLQRVPAIFMTAKVQSHEVLALKNLGAIDIIAKPFDPMSLAEDIRSLWQRYHSELSR